MSIALSGLANCLGFKVLCPKSSNLNLYIRYPRKRRYEPFLQGLTVIDGVCIVVIADELKDFGWMGSNVLEFLVRDDINGFESNVIRVELNYRWNEIEYVDLGYRRVPSDK